MQYRIVIAALAVVVVSMGGRSVAELGASKGARPQSQPPAPARCDQPEHRQFDFWIGEWEVTAPNGRVAGRNSITREMDGCVIHEHWTGSAGMRGESFNMWDRDRKRWHQTWVNTQGNLLVLEGTFQDGSMRLSGESGPADGRVMNRVTWTPAADGSVRQFWEISPDNGKTWKTAFDGAYRKAGSAEARRDDDGGPPAARR
jgi:hypothetical protein